MEAERQGDASEQDETRPEAKQLHVRPLIPTPVVAMPTAISIPSIPAMITAVIPIPITFVPLASSGQRSGVVVVPPVVTAVATRDAVEGL